MSGTAMGPTERHGAGQRLLSFAAADEVAAAADDEAGAAEIYNWLRKIRLQM